MIILIAWNSGESCFIKMKAGGGKEGKDEWERWDQANARSLGYQEQMGSEAKMEGFSFLKAVISLRWKKEESTRKTYSDTGMQINMEAWSLSI